MHKKNIYIATDHAGFELKEIIKVYLIELGYSVFDMGAEVYKEDDDYPDYIRPCAQAIAKDDSSFGIIFGGTGQGEAIVANKVSGIRAGVFCRGDLEIVKLLREHNDANILSIGARFVDEDEARNAVKTFIETDFSEEERHIRRINKIEN